MTHSRLTRLGGAFALALVSLGILAFTNVLAPVRAKASVTSGVRLDSSQVPLRMSRSSIPTCLWASLDLALGQPTGGGLSPNSPRGYTLVIVNIGHVTCSIRGDPTQLEFSTAQGQPLRMAIRHRANPLFAQPRAADIVLRPDQVASFGFSYSYVHQVPSAIPSSCLATELDVRLPARESSLFSDFWFVGIDTCATARVVDVTPVEQGAVPAPGHG